MRDDDGVDLARLQELSARAIPREQIQAAGYCSMCASSDLHHLGYAVRHWHRVADGSQVLEYTGRCSGSDLPRLTATCHAEQAAIHEALGLNSVPPGRAWKDTKGQLEFDFGEGFR